MNRLKQYLLCFVFVFVINSSSVTSNHVTSITCSTVCAPVCDGVVSEKISSVKEVLSVSDTRSKKGPTAVKLEQLHLADSIEEEKTWRDEIIEFATSLDGMGSYSWSSKPGNQLYQMIKTHKENETPIDEELLSLDCSGFVQLMYWIQTGCYDERLSSTYLINEGCTQIHEEELLPGDLGMVFADGSYYILGEDIKCYERSSVDRWLAEDETHTEEDVIQYTNHVGIYVGANEDGTKLWVHCNSKTDGIVVDTFDQFTCYYRVME